MIARVLAAASIAALALLGVRDAGLTSPTIVVAAEFADAAGLAPNAEVTYRGVRVGRVVDLRPVTGGVRAQLTLDGSADVPAAARAIVTTRRAAGGRYLDLRPDSGARPYLRDGDTIPRSRTGGPVPLERLLLNLGALAGSVDARDLAVVVDELARALDGTGPALATLADAQRTLLADAERTLPQTVALLRDSRTVLDRQAASAGALRSWAGALGTVSAQLRSGPPGRAGGLLQTGTDAADRTARLLRQLSPSLGFLLGNLVVLGQVQGRRLGGLEQILISYPAVVAHGKRIVPGDGTAHLALVLAPGAPPPCAGPRCGGARRVPHPPGGEPPAPQQPGRATPAADPDGLPLLLGATGGQASVLGAASWTALLLGPLAA